MVGGGDHFYLRERNRRF